MRLATLLFAALIFPTLASGQKMLLLERANRAKTTKYYIGQVLRFRLVGEEDYWYDRRITDILPESNTLLLGDVPVKVADIAAIRVYQRPIWRIVGGALLTFGGTMAIAATAGRFAYNDRDLRLGRLYGTSVVSAATGVYLLKKRTLRMGDTHRLRAIEVRFGPRQ